MDVELIPPELLRFLVYLLSIGFTITGATLIGVLAFMSRGVLTKLTNIEAAADDQFAAFGRQLNEVRNLLNADLHKHDVRITRLEEWRKVHSGDDD
jgi:hypothetical protein